MAYTIEKKYSIKETTKVGREKIVNDALAIATLDAAAPTERTMNLVQEYIDGKKEISEILKETIAYYREQAKYCND
ncbi:hypothetical protein NE664_03085 [Anaerotignum faecicola]|nr:hypothetical protein [Anaerotignum faecicola]